MPSLIATLGVNISQFQRGLEQASGLAGSHGKSIGSALGERVGSMISGFATPKAALETIEELGKKAVEYADKVGTLATRLGMSTDAVQQWDNALKLSGSSIDDAVPFFEKLSSARAKALRGNEEMLASFQRLGISVQDLKTMRVEDIALQIGDAFEGKDPQELFADLRQVGGRGAGSLMELFQSGARGALEDAKALGTVLDSDVIAKLKVAGDAWVTMLKQGFTMLATIVEPIVTTVTNLVQLLVDGIARTSAVLDGFRKGGLSGALKAQEDYNKAVANREEEAKKKKEDFKTGKEKKLNFDEDEKESAKTKAAQEYARTQERIAKLRDELKKKQEDAAMAEMTPAQKMQFYEKQKIARRELMAAMDDAGELTDEDELEGENRIADLDAKQRGLGLKNAKNLARAGRMDVNAIQRMGGYAAAPEMSILDVNRKSEQHLSSIRKGIDKLANRNTTAVASVEF